MGQNYALWVHDYAQGEFRVEGDFAALVSLRIILGRHYHRTSLVLYRPDGSIVSDGFDCSE